MRKRYAWILALSLCAACAKPPMLPVPTGAARCTVPGAGTASAPWRLVHAIGFSFCVPPDWRPGASGPRGADAKTWYGATGSLTWGLATDIGPIAERVEVTYIAVPGRTPARMDPRDFQQPCTRPVSFTFEVGDATVTTEQYQCQGTYTTTAICHQPGIYLTASARSGAGAESQMAVIRTLRLFLPTP